MWFNAQSISPAKSSPFAPGLAMYQGKLHMVYADQSQNLWHGVYTPSATGGAWNIVRLGAQTSSAAPALIEYQGKLTCFYRSKDTSYTIHYTTLDDSTGQFPNSGTGTSITTQYGPSVAVHGGLLYVAVLPTGTSTHVSYATWNGQTWSAPASVNTITNPTTTAAPTIAEYRGGLHLLFVANNAVSHYIYGNSLVPNQAFLPLGPTGLSTSSSVAAVEWNGYLYTLLRQTASGAGQNTIVAATFDGGEWTAPVSTGTTTTSAGPSVAPQAEMLQIVFPNTSNSLVQGTGFAGGDAPLTRVPIAALNGNASVTTSVPNVMFGGMHPYTVEAWVNLSSTGGTQYAVSSFDAAANAGLMAIAIRDGKFAAYRNGYWLPSVTAPQVNTWYHVAVTFDGGAYTCLFVNGNLESTEINDQPSFPASTGPVMIGAASNGPGGAPAGKLQGMVRWVAMWNVARSAADLSTDLYAQLAPQSGLMALYDFSGAAPVDVSGRAQSATVSGTLAMSAETQGLLLSGASGLNCGFGNTLNFPSNQALTTEAWVRPTSTSSTAYVLLRSGEYQLGLDSSGWFGSAGNQSPLSSGSAPIANAWTHVAFTWQPSGNNATATLYVNGVAVATQTQPATSAVGGNKTNIGCTETGSAGFHGCIASVRLWSRALAANEIKAAMTQSSVGMDDLAANYDFSTTPILDATLNNDAPTNIGSPTLGYVTETITAQQAAQLLADDTSAAIPYYPDEPGEVYDFATPPTAPARSAPATAQVTAKSVDEILTPAYLQQLLDTFHRSIPPGTADAIRQHLATVQTAELQRLFLLARNNPRHGLGGHRFEFRRCAEHTVLVHHRPDGTSVDAAVLATASFTPQQLWWIQFTLTLVFGFASILGIATPGSLAGKLTKYIVKNPAILAILEVTVDIGVAITPEVVYNSLSALWNGKFLMGMIKLIAVELGWWALAQLAIRLLGLFIPGVQEMIVATMLVNFTIMAIQLSLLALDYPR